MGKIESSRCYDAFEHLWSSYFAAEDDLFMMLTGYFDDTNSDPKSAVPMVAGYLSSQFRWSRFNKDWADLLIRHNVPIDPDFQQRISHRKKMHPENTLFGQWVKDGYREPFLKEATAVIRHHIKMPIGNAVYRKDFEEIVRESFKKMIGGCHGWCAYSTLCAIRGYCKKVNHKDPVRIVFEEGTEGEGQVKKWYDKMKKDMEAKKDFRLSGYSTGDKRLRPLQAADLFAYALGRYAKDYSDGAIRGSVLGHLGDVLGEKKPEYYRVVFWDRPALEGLAKSLVADGFKAWERSPIA